jgi:uncharacterized protein YciI/uncharacterized protein YndB with AHSA1/START domain
MSVESVKKQLIVKAPIERAFRVFTAGIDKWWPRDHHIGASPMKELVMEPKEGGRWYAKCEDGSECDTGKVLVWDPPTRLVLAWQITAKWAFDPSFVTEIEVRFAPDGARCTRVDFEHRDLDRYGAEAEAIRAQLGDPKGWNGNLERYARSLRMKAAVMYESAPDVLTKAPVHFAAHKARLDVFQARGDLLAVGVFGDPREGSMAIFGSREAAEEFVREDPFVLRGGVATASIKDWDETILP